MAKIDLGNGFMQMDTVPTGTGMDTLAESGRIFGRDWMAVVTRIAAGEAGIGDDARLGGQFRPNYGPAADSLRQSAGSVQPALDGFAGGGREVIAAYVEEARKNAENLRRAGER